MSPSRTSEQPAMIQEHSAVRGQSQLPRGGRDQPYSTTSAAAPHFLAMEGPPLRGPHAQPEAPMQGAQNNNPMSDM
eukprot:5324616-Amphidinium_carterae.1